MANSTLLSLFQTSLQAMGVAGYGMPASVISNTNQDVVQTLALVHAAGGDMGREFQWQQMTKQYIFQTKYYTYTGTLNAESGNTLYLPGDSGDYASTPDSSTISIAGDIEIIAYVALNDWTPTNQASIVAKRVNTDDQRSYRMFVSASGLLSGETSSAGSSGTLTTSSSTVAISGTAGSGMWLRWTRDVNDGSGNHVDTFYTSTDAVSTSVGSISWTQLGATVTTAGAVTIYDSTAPLQIGGSSLGTVGVLDGRAYKAYVYDGLVANSGTLAASFDANDGTIGATTFASSGTGETYTVYGSAAIAAAASVITSLSSVYGLTADANLFAITGTGIAQDALLISASDNSNMGLMNIPATAAGSAVSLTFSQVLFTPPSDFDRLIDSTQWDKSKHWQMLGPETAQQREWLRSGYISTGPRIRYWQMGGYWQIWPPLGVNESLATEYVSKWWICATGSMAATKEIFTADTDTCIFPDPLMRALIRLKYFEAKGFDTTALYREFLAQRDLAFAHDSGSPNLSMAPKPATALLGWGNIPDSGYGT